MDPKASTRQSCEALFLKYLRTNNLILFYLDGKRSSDQARNINMEEVYQSLQLGLNPRSFPIPYLIA
jgi:hypothetical protein